MTRVLLTGANGLIGTALGRSLHARGTGVCRLVRSEAQSGPDAVLWRPDTEEPLRDLSGLEGCHAAVHLAGANVAGHRWTTGYKQEIRTSRVRTTLALVEILQRLKTRPKVLVSASATGIYGCRGDELLTEHSAPGSGFLAEVCREWEAAAETARQYGVRVVRLRFGVVLTPGGGALGKMLPVFRAGLGGKLGGGRQWMSWITLRDAVSAIEFAMENVTMAGAYNVVSPQPVTNAEWTRTLSGVLHRPALLPAPAFALRLAFGEMAQESVLASTRALPKRLEAEGFPFADPELKGALRALLDRAAANAP